MPVDKKDTTGKPAKGSKGKKYQVIPARLPQALVEDIDAIAKAENLSRNEVFRRAVEAFSHNYKTDQLDQRQIKLEKQMKAMENSIRTLLVKAIRLNGQVLYFATLPYTMGPPKAKLNAHGFQTIYDNSAQFANQFLQSKAAGKKPVGQGQQAPASPPEQPSDEQ